MGPDHGLGSKRWLSLWPGRWPRALSCAVKGNCPAQPWGHSARDAHHGWHWLCICPPRCLHPPQCLGCSLHVGLKRAAPASGSPACSSGLGMLYLLPGPGLRLMSPRTPLDSGALKTWRPPPLLYRLPAGPLLCSRHGLLWPLLPFTAPWGMPASPQASSLLAPKGKRCLRRPQAPEAVLKEALEERPWPLCTLPS